MAFNERQHILLSIAIGLKLQFVQFVLEPKSDRSDSDVEGFNKASDYGVLEYLRGNFTRRLTQFVLFVLAVNPLSYLLSKGKVILSILLH